MRAQCPLPMGTRCASPLYERLAQPLPLGTSCANGLAVPLDGGEGGETGLLMLPAAGASCLRSLWRLQRNEPGWFVGEHMHERRILGAAVGEEGRDETLTDLTGEPAAESLRRESEADW